MSELGSRSEPAIRRKPTRRRNRRRPFGRETSLLLIIAAFASALAAVNPAFLTHSNLLSLAMSTVYDLPLALGMTLVLITGGIDLSVGAVLALAGVVVTLAMRHGIPVGAAIAVSVLLASGVGMLNGLLVTRWRLAPFVVTLSTMSIARGVALVLTSGYMISGLPPAYVAVGRASWLGVPVPLWIVAALLAGTARLLHRWKPLHDAFYVGSNPEAARLSGLPVSALTVAVYVASGACAGVAAVFVTSRLGMGYARFGDLAELRAIAAAVLGGATFGGGTGSVIGAALGVVLLALILNGFVLLNIDAYWQSVAGGLILIVAVGVDAVRRRRAGGAE